jgi:uncharacterized membrane protein YGL010W
MSDLNLNKFQRFFYNYGRYHNDKVNVWIHIICIPIITVTLGILLEYLSNNVLESKINILYVLHGLLLPVYAYVDMFVGLFTFAEYLLLHLLVKDCDFSICCLSSIQTILALHIAAWILQFIGHGVYEKRKPALLDNVLLIFNAPVFVNIEIFIMLFKYREEEIEETKKYIVEDIAKFRNAKVASKKDD